MGDYFEEMEGGCSNSKLKTFSRVNYSYINQIFGDYGVRKLIQKLYKKPGVLLVVPGEGAYAESDHHVFSPSRKSKKSEHICSVEQEYQNGNVDINDTLCQSYSLMTYLGIEFDKTPVASSTYRNKYNRQMSMVKMYRDILANPVFLEEFKKLIARPEYNKVWEDIVNNLDKFYIIERLTADKIISNIHIALSVWERYGWQYYVKKGGCMPRANVGPESATAVAHRTPVAASATPRRLFYSPPAPASAGAGGPRAPVSVNAPSRHLFYSPPAPPAPPAPAPSVPAPKRGRSTVKANNNSNNAASPSASRSSGSQTRSKRRRSPPK